MFESLSKRIDNIFSKLRDKGVLTEENVKETLKEIRAALLEADVNFKVVKNFIKRVEEEAIGQEIHKSLSPGQQIIKIVHAELEELLGKRGTPLVVAPISPTVVMMVGLQGSGKTTTSGKLARLLKADDKKVLLVGADVFRPAARQQLKTLSEKVGCDFFSIDGENDAVKIVKEGLAFAKQNGNHYVIFDTAGRLHIDEKMMGELKQVKETINPHEVLFVADAMTGQDAVHSAKQFNNAVEVTGVILTKMDGDARGGAALSIREVTGKPIKYLGIGEKLDGLEVFHPDRLAQRILGMGDVMSLIEKTEKEYDLESAKNLEKKMRKNEFDMNDFLDQLKQIKKMGGIGEIMGMLPGMGGAKGMDVDEKEFVRIEAIIQSMTNKERINFTILNGSRRKRIARGSGTTVQEVNRLIKQFQQMKKMMGMINKSGKKGMGNIMNMLGMGGGGGNAMNMMRR